MSVQSAFAYSFQPTKGKIPIHVCKVLHTLRVPICSFQGGDAGQASEVRSLRWRYYREALQFAYAKLCIVTNGPTLLIQAPRDKGVHSWRLVFRNGFVNSLEYDPASFRSTIAAILRLN